MNKLTATCVYFLNSHAHTDKKRSFHKKKLSTFAKIKTNNMTYITSIYYHRIKTNNMNKLTATLSVLLLDGEPQRYSNTKKSKHARFDRRKNRDIVVRRKLTRRGTTTTPEKAPRRRVRHLRSANNALPCNCSRNQRTQRRKRQTSKGTRSSQTGVKQVKQTTEFDHVKITKFYSIFLCIIKLNFNLFSF